MEGFFSSMKTERTASKLFRISDEAQADAFDDIKRFYNPRRRRSKPGNLIPKEIAAPAMTA